MNKINEIFSLQMGCYEPRFEKGKDKVELLKSSNFNNDDIKVIKTIYDSNSKYVVTGNEILMRQVGNVEFYIHESNKPTYFDSTIIKLVPIKNINIYYILYKLNNKALKRQIEINSTGGLVGKINLSEFGNMTLDLSDLASHEIIGRIYELKLKKLKLYKRRVELEELTVNYI